MEWPKSVIFSTRDMVEKGFPGADANGTRNQREKQDSVRTISGVSGVQRRVSWRIYHM